VRLLSSSSRDVQCIITQLFETSHHWIVSLHKKRVKQTQIFYGHQPDIVLSRMYNWYKLA